MTETIVIAVLGSGVLSAIVSGCFALAQQKRAERSKDAKLVDVLAYDRIKYLGKKYIAEGRITYEDLEDISRMWQCYHEAGGNGYLDDVMTAVRRLPIGTK